MKLHRFAFLTAVMAGLLIVAGGLVTSTGSSLAVPDWPLSYGQFFPPMVGGILFEHGHRMIAGTVAIMTLVLAVWIWTSETRRWVRFLAAAALGGIFLQALLGGITVLYRLPHPISIAHACLGQTVFCLLVILAQATSEKFCRRPAELSLLSVVPDIKNSVRTEFVMVGATQEDYRLVVPIAITITAVYIQLILGAVVRHTGAGVAIHMLWAVVTSGVILWACYKTISGDREPWLARPAWILLGLLPIQVVLGFSALVARAHAAAAWTFWPVALRTGHVACGASILAVSVLWLLRATTNPHSALSQREREKHPLARLRERVGGEGRDYIELCKPRISLMSVVTAVIGFSLAGGSQVNPHALIWLVLGTGLAAAASGTLNQVWEKDCDALMLRTQKRPLPQGRISPARAWIFGLVLASAGLSILAWKVNGLSCGLTAFTVVTYVLFYTPLKKLTPQSTWIGAVSGAMPPVIGWAAARGTLNPEAGALFAIQFLWQIPHFMSLFWIYRDQYAMAGFKVMPVVHPSGGTTACQIAIHSFALIPASLMPLLSGMAGVHYGWGALALGIAFLLLGLRASWTMAVIDTRRLFLASLAYLPMLFVILALGRIA